MQRRDFLAGALKAGALLPLAGSGLMARPLGDLLLPRSAEGAGRILVLINLNGGNDGLNSVVPIEDPAYHAARPNLALSASETHAISDGLALHPQLAAVKGMFEEGTCAIVSSVGYPGQDRSHFRSTDIWHTASDAETVLTTGWIGRYLEASHPEYPESLPSSPFAIQIATSATLALQGEMGGTGLAIDNPDRFYNLAKGLSVPEDPVPATLAGPELSFVRNVIAQSNQYSTKIQGAMLDGSTNVTYDADSLSSQLKVVARLINGGLETAIYVVSLGGFDTHNQQLAAHAQLMQRLGSAVSKFLEDVRIAGNGDRVALMTYSEFGRRLNENGSLGTDHGAAAPQFVFGRQVLGGKVIGGAPDLTKLDNRGDVLFVHDFREIYASVLRDWLGFSATDTTRVLGGEFARLDLFPMATTDARDEHDARRVGLDLSQCRPNPARDRTEIAFALPAEGRVRLGLIAEDGRRISTVVDRTLERGEHRVRLDVDRLSPGRYFYRIDWKGFALVRSLTVVR